MSSGGPKFDTQFSGGSVLLPQLGICARVLAVASLLKMEKRPGTDVAQSFGLKPDSRSTVKTATKLSKKTSDKLHNGS